MCLALETVAQKNVQIAHKNVQYNNMPEPPTEHHIEHKKALRLILRMVEMTLFEIAKPDSKYHKDAWDWLHDDSEDSWRFGGYCWACDLFNIDYEAFRYRAVQDPAGVAKRIRYEFFHGGKERK